ncbi:hypothetical protein [Candidatus Parabeggiatoa sp. HSG14]|uniref:hypothetical protein n=1 Tax=Candidatus Parabeggiatoa sp. HSG14 TaxID=3055593 RepID=UPI0025A7CBE2|nr:hypothetical protein [Thiotrichales bacterium HSG14]
MNQKQHTPHWAIKPLVAEEVYTDRQEFLDYFYKSALKTKTRRTGSTVLLGQRRMGKTEIFKRVVNRLFFEQDHRDPEAVVPIYYSFPDHFKNHWDFALKYAENFLRWYAAFRLRDITLLSVQTSDRRDLIEIVRNNAIFSESFKSTINLIEAILNKNATMAEEWALWQPRRVSDYDDTSIAVFLDEFQNTRLPHYDFDIVGYMQEAVESPTCPHFVTGSAMSILAREILGRGMLFGRFESHLIEPLTGYWGTELARRTAKYHKASISEKIAPIVAERCGGNPFYINAVIKQAAKQDQAISNEESLNNLLAVDLSSGFIWAELNDQVSKWIERINEYGITKWVLYLSALEEGDRLDLERIQQALLEQEGKQVSLEKIRDILIKLSRGDLLQYMELGGWFKKVDDPILLEFLKVWGRIEVQGRDGGQVRDELQQKYRRMKRQISELIGYLAEVYMMQILLNAQRQNLPGQYFHQETDIEIPRFNYVRLRERLGIGIDKEIDIHGAAGIEHWVAESKWYQDRAVGVSLVKKLLEKADLVKKERTPDFVRVWFFAHNGFTQDAESFMQAHNIFWSTRADLDKLLTHVGLRTLPKLNENSKGKE